MDTNVIGSTPVGGRVMGVFPPMLPPVLPDGRVPTFRFIGRFNALTAPAANSGETVGTRIVSPNESRVALILQNVGNGLVYVSHENVLSSGAAMVIPVTTGQLFFAWPNAPMQEMYALGDANHDLRVIEVAYRFPVSFLTTEEDDIDIR